MRFGTRQTSIREECGVDVSFRCDIYIYIYIIIIIRSFIECMYFYPIANKDITYIYVIYCSSPACDEVILVRADVSRMPFLSCSVPRVHAGAALHCWPSPLTALAEIYR